MFLYLFLSYFIDIQIFILKFTELLFVVIDKKLFFNALSSRFGLFHRFH
jgi:hypothetical protein